MWSIAYKIKLFNQTAYLPTGSIYIAPRPRIDYSCLLNNGEKTNHLDIING